MNSEMDMEMNMESKSIYLKSNQTLVFEERGKPEYLEKNLLEQSREATNSTYIINMMPHW